jgi:hypothetical protein
MGPPARVGPHGHLDGDDGVLSGHAGEWLSVQAGALGRALALRCDDVVDAQVAAIEAELGREARAVTVVDDRKPGGEVRGLRASSSRSPTTWATSRVIEAWPEGTPRRRVPGPLHAPGPRESAPLRRRVRARRRGQQGGDGRREPPLSAPAAPRALRTAARCFCRSRRSWTPGAADLARDAGRRGRLGGRRGPARRTRAISASGRLGAGPARDREALPGGLDRVAPGQSAARLRKLAAAGPVRS